MQVTPPDNLVQRAIPRQVAYHELGILGVPPRRDDNRPPQTLRDATPRTRSHHALRTTGCDIAAALPHNFKDLHRCQRSTLSVPAPPSCSFPARSSAPRDYALDLFMDIPCDHGLAELERNVCQRRTALLAFDAASKDGDQIHLQEALAEALVVTHDISHDLSRLDEAISLYERILDVDSAEIVHRVRALTGLGHALWRLCEFHDEDAVRLRRAVGLLREALNLCPIGHPAQAETLYALGLALHTCFEQLSDPDSLSEAIGVLRNALRMCPLGHPLRDDSLNGLANALFTRFEHQGGTDVLTEVISLHRQALQLRLPGHPRRVKSLNNLAIALQTKFEQHGGRDTLADVIALHREVLELRPIGNSLRAQTLNNLAAALRTDFEEHGGVDALTEATALCREALNMRLPGHPLRDNSLNTLATILFMSFERQGDEDALSEAIVLFREALTMRPPPHVLRSTSLDGLARALQASFELWDFPETLQEAITLHHEALRLRPVPHPLRDETQHHFAVALETSYSISPSPDILTEAVALYREALYVRVDAHPYRHLSLMGLASALSQLAAESNEPLSWREVVSLYEEALTLCPRGHPLRPQINSRLGRCLLIPTSPIFDFDLGVERLLEGLADGYAPVKERLQDASKDLRAVEKAYNTALNEADTPEQTRRRRNVLELYQQAIQLLPRMANFGMGHLARYRTLMGSDEISRNAATRALLLGRVSQAVEMLEEGRGLFWSQALRLRTSGLDDVPEADRVELQRLFDRLDDGAHSVNWTSLERPPEIREQELENQRQLSLQAEALIARIRTYAGLERFLMPAAFDSLLQTLPNGFVVIVNASSLGCHAVMLSRNGALAESLEVQLPRGLTLDSATIRASLPREARYTAQGTLRHSRAMRLSKIVPQELEDLLLTLWTAVVNPIVRKLGLQVSKTTPRVDRRQ
jgi:tetratricopeptide (TPR) repeat protein